MLQCRRLAALTSHGQRPMKSRLAYPPATSQFTLRGDGKRTPAAMGGDLAFRPAVAAACEQGDLCSAWQLACRTMAHAE
jgi:hypothetical protein